MTSIFLRLASFIILSLPLLIEVYRERNGEKKEEHKESLLRRLFFTLVAYFIVFIIERKLVGITQTWQDVLSGLFMSFAIFLLLFDYSIAATLEKRGVIKKGSSWFNYLSSSDFDTWKPWVRIGAWGRFILKVIVFALALVFWI